MNIQKIINNNVISAVNDKNEEVVVMGRGIGFKAHAGDAIDETKIEKVFRIENETISRQFQEILENIPLEHMQLTEEIISKAKEVLKVKLNQSIYVTLTDHINFAIQRQKEGVRLKNALLWEIKEFYRSEYQIGQYAIELLNEKIKTDFTEDEAGFIALHIVNAEYNTSIHNTFAMTNMIQELLQFIQKEMGRRYDENSIHYERYLAHLKFLARRVCDHNLLPDDDMEFAARIEQKYPAEYECSRKAADYIKMQYHENLSEEEILYLAIHIKRVFMED